MKKRIVFTLLFISIIASAQDWGASGDEYNISVNIPKIGNLNQFLFSQYELNPADIPNKLSDIENLKKTNENSSLVYTISKSDNGYVDVNVFVFNKMFSEATYKNGLLDGKKIIYHSNGRVCHEIEFKKGKANGTYKLYSDTSELVFETNFKDNVKHGLRKFYNPRRENEIIEGNYENGTLKGDLIYSNGYTTYHLPNDLKKGVVKCFSNDILVSEFSIIDENEIHGEAKMFNPTTGKLEVKVPFYLGEKHGKVEFFNENGEVISTLEYRFGKKIGTHKIYKGKKLHQESYYDDNGYKIGTWKTYDPNGLVASEVTYINDAVEGYSKSYQKGVLLSEIHYESGKKQGLSKYYNGVGVLTSDVFYENDSMIKEITYYPDGSIYYVNEQNIQNNTFSIKYYDNKGNFIHENKYNEKRNPIGIHKFIDKDTNSNYTIQSISHYDDNGKKLKHLSYSYPYNGSYTESNFRNDVLHGPKTTYKATTNETTVEYYYESKGKQTKVSKEEFEKLVAAEKK